MTPAPSKMERRRAAFATDSWEHGAGISRRRYSSYGEYVEHQSEKIDQIAPRLQAGRDKALARFVSRFENCPELRGPILCLGARLGTEVEALHRLGHFAVGVDLNPGAGNPYVLQGDFHALVFPDHSFDTVYTNVFDHVFDVAKFMAEIRRVLKPSGHFITDTIVGHDEGFYIAEYEAMHWPRVEPFLQSVAATNGFDWVRGGLIPDEPLWFQAVMKPITF